MFSGDVAVRELSVGGLVQMFGEHSQYRIVGIRKIATSSNKNSLLILRDEASTGKQIYSVSIKDLVSIAKNSDNWNEEQRKNQFQIDSTAFTVKKEEKKRKKKRSLLLKKKRKKRFPQEEQRECGCNRSKRLVKQYRV